MSAWIFLTIVPASQTSGLIARPATTKTEGTFVGKKQKQNSKYDLPGVSPSAVDFPDGAISSSFPPRAVSESPHPFRPASSLPRPRVCFSHHDKNSSLPEGLDHSPSSYQVSAPQHVPCFFFQSPEMCCVPLLLLGRELGRYSRTARGRRRR